MYCVRVYTFTYCRKDEKEVSHIKINCTVSGLVNIMAISLSAVSMSGRLSACLAGCLSVWPSVCLAGYMSAHLCLAVYVYMSACLSVWWCMSICLPVCISAAHLIHVPRVHILFVCLSVLLLNQPV